MKQWEIAKKLLVDDGFCRLYESYLQGLKLSRSVRNYGRIDMSTRSRDELHNMLKKLNRCESLVHWATDHYNLPFDYDRIKGYKGLVREQLNYITWRNNKEPNTKVSRREKRRLAAQSSNGRKSKNR